MEENTSIIEDTEQTDISEERHIEPRRNNVIYTVISVLIFAMIYGVWHFAQTKLFRDYSMTVSGSELSAEQLDIAADFSGISWDRIDHIRLDKTNGKTSAVICFRETGAPEDFADMAIMYEYGDIAEDIRTEIYPYGNGVPEYVFADSYVNIDDPSRYCLVYSYNGEDFAEYHSDTVSSEFAALFMGAEKVYAE
ncbi:MAG: hypothetical protein ACI4JF_08030 [Oscillospiraceae bacterium]